MVGAISLMPNQNVFDPSILPTEYWMIAGIILATMVITTGAILSFTRITLKTQDQALLASEHPTQARASQTTQATSLTQAIFPTTQPKPAVEQATTEGAGCKLGKRS